MWPDRVSNPGPLTYESGALSIALRGPALVDSMFVCSPFTQEVVKSRVRLPPAAHVRTIFRSNRPGYPYPVCSKLENSGTDIAVSLNVGSGVHLFKPAKLYIPDFRRQPGNRSRPNRVYRFIMELVSFSPLLFKLFMISLLCKRLLILHYLTNVHIYFVLIFVHNFLVLSSLNWKYPLFL